MTPDGGHKSLFDDDWEKLPYFASSQETVFDKKLLMRFGSQVLLGQQSFVQCADVYNHLHGVLGEDSCYHPMIMYVYSCLIISALNIVTPICRLKARQKLDRRRVEDASFNLLSCSCHLGTLTLSN